MDVNHKDVIAVLPKKINDIGRIDGLKKWAGHYVDIVIASNLVTTVDDRIEPLEIKPIDGVAGTFSMHHSP